jgi:hypothetical protein
MMSSAIILPDDSSKGMTSVWREMGKELIISNASLAVTALRNSIEQPP